VPVLAHRIMPSAQFGLRGLSSESLIAAIVEAVPVPVEAAAQL
jgi:hypothetical protein